VVTIEEAVASSHRVRSCGGAVALVNGAFDLLHVGHLRYLRGAREVLDRRFPARDNLLVAAVNSDRSVREAKGVGRPTVPAAERAELVAGILGVDVVVVFDAATVAPIIVALRPELHAKGTDYTVASIPEADVVRACGGECVIVGDPKAHSTSAMVAMLQNKDAR
jgi:rfaE bifunctional protein nucleotidyltransferase chain/domain